MNVVYYSSNFFSEICAVSIESLCENNRNASDISIYIIEDQITEKNKQRLKDITDSFHRELFFIRMPSQAELYPDVRINLGRTYTRMAIGELLPANVMRCLSLDSDTIILDSLQEMYDTKFSDNEYVAGVYDCVGRAIQEHVLQYDSSLKYCNAGMFLIDLEKWRKFKVGDQLINKLNELADGKHVLYFLEQDLMNLTFYGHIKLLHPRYNLLTSIYLFNYNEVMKMKKPTSYYGSKTIKYAKAKPAIVHATTCFYVRKRMWVDDTDHPYGNWYMEYRSRTPWGVDEKIRDERKFTKKLYALFWHIMPRKVAVAIATFVINYLRPFYARLTAKFKLSTVAEQSST